MIRKNKWKAFRILPTKTGEKKSILPKENYVIYWIFTLCEDHVLYVIDQVKLNYVNLIVYVNTFSF